MSRAEGIFNKSSTILQSRPEHILHAHEGRFGSFQLPNLILNEPVCSLESETTEHILLKLQTQKALFSSYAQGVSGAGRKHSGLIFWVKFVDLSSELFL